MNQEPIYVGIDVSKSRLDVGVRPGGDGRSMAYDEAGPRDLASRRSGVGSHRRVGGARGGLAYGSGLARGGGQSSPGARFCQSHRQVGQDRCPGCPGAGAFRPGGPSAGAPVAGRGYPGAHLPDHPTQPGNDHAGGREEPFGSGHSGSASAHPSPHRLVGAGTGGPGQRSEADSPPEPRVAGAGTTCCAASPALGSNSPLRCWRTCRNWVHWTGSGLPPWWEWLPSTGTAGRCEVSGPSGAAGLE